MDTLLKDLLDFLADNPGASVLIALIIFWRIGKDILLPIIKGNNENTGEQLDISKNLTQVITNQQTTMGNTLTSIETLNKELVVQQEKTNSYFDKLVSSSDKQVDNMERWLTAIGDGVKGIMDSHETLALDRFNMMQGIILQITSKQNALDTDMRSAFNVIGERLFIIQQKIENNPTEPLVPIKATATIAAVVVEEKQPNEP